MGNKKKSAPAMPGRCLVLTVREAAQMAGVSERFIRRLIRSGVLRPVWLPGVIRLNKGEFLRKLRETKGDAAGMD